MWHGDADDVPRHLSLDAAESIPGIRVFVCMCVWEVVT